jgi:RNA polymerase sigma factor (sigma-70 family)
MNDLRLELRVKNLALYKAIHEQAESVADFCRKFGDSFHLQIQVGAYLNLKESPWRAGKDEDGLAYIKLSKTGRWLCDVTGLGPEALFPFEIYTLALPPVLVAEVSSFKFLPLSAAKRLSAGEEDSTSDERKKLIREALSTLTPREQLVLESRFGFNGRECTRPEIADVLGVSTMRIRQIEAKALRKMRHPTRRLKYALP